MTPNNQRKNILSYIGNAGKYIVNTAEEYLKPTLNTALEIIKEEKRTLLLPAMLAIGMGWTGFAYGAGLQVAGKMANRGIDLGGAYSEVVGKAGEYEGFGKIPSADIFDVNTNLKRASRMKGIERLAAEKAAKYNEANPKDKITPLEVLFNEGTENYIQEIERKDSKQE